MTVDAHHHLWDLDVRDQSWIVGESMAPIRRDFQPADLRDALKRSTVDSTVLVQTVSDERETPEMLVLADTVECVAAVVGWVDLTACDVRERIGMLQAHPSGHWLKGIRHQVESEPDPDWLVRPEVLAGLAAVDDAGLVYELLVRPHQLPAARRAVAAHPQLTFVLDHCAKPPVATGELEPWAGELRALARYPNVVCKLSGLATEDDWSGWRDTEGLPEAGMARLRRYFDVVLDAFGPNRLMFGSDWPVCLLAASYGQVFDAAAALTAELGEREQEAIFEGTAREIYRL
jgi:L-fuconolactonase